MSAGPSCMARRKAAVLNNWLQTWGGGEKNTYAVASTLARLGWDVDVLTFEERVPTTEEVARFFGPGHDGFRIVSLAGQGLDERARDARLKEFLRPHTLFLNQSNGSTFPNPCPLGVYLVMFPFQEAGEWVRTYHHYLCNSEFTRSYVEARWGKDLATGVLYPSVDEPAADADARREPEILAIGRFTWEGHAKNQDLLVEAFARVVDALPKGWTLTLLGKVHHDPVTLARMERLRGRCRRLPVRFEIDATGAEKSAALHRATVFWHGTGLERVEPHEAWMMEHFGIAVVEAMVSGAIPMCYHRGGPREIVRHAESGFLYRDLDELAAYTQWVANAPSKASALRRSAIERAALFSRERFDATLADFLSRVVAA